MSLSCHYCYPDTSTGAGAIFQLFRGEQAAFTFFSFEVLVCTVLSLKAVGKMLERCYKQDSILPLV